MNWMATESRRCKNPVPARQIKGRITDLIHSLELPGVSRNDIQQKQMYPHTTGELAEGATLEMQMQSQADSIHLKVI